MGIDASLVIKYRGEKPTEDQITRWSWDMCRSVGARHFFIGDGLPAAEYQRANRSWHAAFNAHPLYADWRRLRESDFESAKGVHDQILAAVGPVTELRRRAIEFSGYSSVAYSDDSAELLRAQRDVGLVYTQDGEDVLADPGEHLLTVGLWTRYYGKGYERGDLMTICAVAEWVEANMQPCEVWYGGDSSGVCIEPFPESARSELRRHLYGQQGRDYFNYGARDSWMNRPTSLPPSCGLCVPGEERRSQYGSGMNYAAVSCAGCGKNFETRDNGATWSVVKDKD